MRVRDEADVAARIAAFMAGPCPTVACAVTAATSAAAIRYLAIATGKPAFTPFLVEFEVRCFRLAVSPARAATLRSCAAMAQVRRYEAKLATQRIKDNFTLELEKTIQTDRMLGENFRSDGRVVQTRITNEQKAAQQNMYATQQLMSASIAQQREAVLREQDERLAAELARRKTQAVREAKNVQRICEQSEELRALEEKLKAAYMNKERECQIKESAHLIAKQAESESIMAQTMEADRQRGLQAEAYREFLRQQDGRAMRAELDKQVHEKMTLKAEAYQQFLKEKEMVDKVVEAIIEEDRRETEARHAKEKEIKSYIDAFIVQQEEYKHKRRVEIEEENAKIRAYAEHVMAREQAMRLEREKDQNAKDAALEKISGDMAARCASPPQPRTPPPPRPATSFAAPPPPHPAPPHASACAVPPHLHQSAVARASRRQPLARRAASPSRRRSRPPLLPHSQPTREGRDGQSAQRARHPRDRGEDPSKGEGEDGARGAAAHGHCARERVPASAQGDPARGGEAGGGGL